MEVCVAERAHGFRCPRRHEILISLGELPSPREARPRRLIGSRKRVTAKRQQHACFRPHAAGTPPVGGGVYSKEPNRGRQAIARRLAADWHDGQNSASRRPQINGLTPAVPFRQEGRSRVVTNAGRDVVDATASARIAVAGRVEPRERLTGAQDERRFSVRQNRVVLTPVAGAKSAVANSNPTGLEEPLKSADDGDKTNSSPGRAR